MIPEATVYDTTAFQMDILLAIKGVEDGYIEDVPEPEEKCPDGILYGEAIKSVLERWYDESVRSALVHRNLDQLIEKGYVGVDAASGRANRYRLTGDGRTMVNYRRIYFTRVMDE